MDDFVDRIYEASAIPDLWIDVLDRIAAIAGCDGGILLSVDSQKSVRAVASDSLVAMLDRFINGGWMRQNIRAGRLGPMNYSGFVVDYDLVTPEEAETDPLYVEVLRKYGGGLGTGTLYLYPRATRLFSISNARTGRDRWIAPCCQRWIRCARILPVPRCWPCGSDWNGLEP